MDPLDKILSVIVLNAIVIVSEESEEDMRRWDETLRFYNQQLKLFLFQEESEQLHCFQVRKFW